MLASLFHTFQAESGVVNGVIFSYIETGTTGAMEDCVTILDFALEQFEKDLLSADELGACFKSYGGIKNYPRVEVIEAYFSKITRYFLDNRITVTQFLQLRQSIFYGLSRASITSEAQFNYLVKRLREANIQGLKKAFIEVWTSENSQVHPVYTCYGDMQFKKGSYIYGNMATDNYNQLDEDIKLFYQSLYAMMEDFIFNGPGDDIETRVKAIFTEKFLRYMTQLKYVNCKLAFIGFMKELMSKLKERLLNFPELISVHTAALLCLQCNLDEVKANMLRGAMRPVFHDSYPSQKLSFIFKLIHDYPFTIVQLLEFTGDRDTKLISLLYSRWVEHTLIEKIIQSALTFGTPMHRFFSLIKQGDSPKYSEMTPAHQAIRALATKHPRAILQAVKSVQQPDISNKLYELRYKELRETLRDYIISIGNKGGHIEDLLIQLFIKKDSSLHILMSINPAFESDSCSYDDVQHDQALYSEESHYLVELKNYLLKSRNKVVLRPMEEDAKKGNFTLLQEALTFGSDLNLLLSLDKDELYKQTTKTMGKIRELAVKYPEAVIQMLTDERRLDPRVLYEFRYESIRDAVSKCIIEKSNKGEGRALACAVERGSDLYSVMAIPENHAKNVESLEANVLLPVAAETTRWMRLLDKTHKTLQAKSKSAAAAGSGGLFNACELTDRSPAAAGAAL